MFREIERPDLVGLGRTVNQESGGRVPRKPEAQGIGGSMRGLEFQRRHAGRVSLSAASRGGDLHRNSGSGFQFAADTSPPPRDGKA